LTTIEKKREMVPCLLDHGLEPKRELWVTNVESIKNAKFLGVFPFSGRYDIEQFVFWNDTPHPRGSNYFSIYQMYNMEAKLQSYITNAIAVEGREFHEI